MIELTLLGACFIFLGVALWVAADSDDDDNSGGGLKEPALIPIPVRHHHR